MANPYLILWFDPTLNKLYTGWQNNSPADTPILKQGDNIGVELHWVKSGSANFPMQEVAFPPAADITLAVGRLDTEPSSGAFTVTYGASTTAELNYDITATDLQTALNGLASITAEGGVAVNKTGSNFRIVWNTPSVTANTLSADVNNLSPTSDSQVIVARAGSATDRQIILFSLKQAPIAACVSFATSPAPAITSTSIFANTWRVSIEPSPRTGTFTLSQTVGVATTTTDPIAYNATAQSVQEKLNAVLAGYYVIKSGEFSWDITAPSSVVSLTATSALVPYSSMYGILSMNTAEVEEFLAGENSATATLEVQADISGEVQTLLQTSVTVINDLISTSIFNLVQLPDVMPVDAVVRYDTLQTPTAGEQLVARTNIAAAAATDITALQAADVVIDGRLDLVEAAAVTQDEKDAIAGADTPSATNVFITQSALDTGLATKAELVHYHIATDITDTTVAGRNLMTASDASAQRTFLGLGSIATYNSGDYLSTAAASANYLSIATASSTYLTIANASITYSPLFNQTLNTSDSVAFAGIDIASGSVLTSTLSSSLELASGWTVTVHGGGLDTVLSWDGLAVGGTTGISLNALGAGITFPDATTQTTLTVREWQANGSGFSTGGFDTAHYPKEVKVVASDGTEYWVAARPV